MSASGQKRLSILFTHFGEPWIRGSEQVLIDLVTNLDRSRFDPVIWCNAGPLQERLSAAGLPVYRSNFTSFFNYGSPPFSFSRYCSFVKQGFNIVRAHQVGLLHSNGAAPHQWLLPVAYRAKLPLLAHLHAPYLRRERFASLLHHATTIVGVSQSVVQEFLKDGVPPGRVRVIHNGIALQRFCLQRRNQLRGKLGLTDRSILVASVGSLIERKGMDLLMRSIACIPDPDLHLVIAGEGPERAALEQLAADLGVRSRTHFLGYCGDISELYAEADIAALASRSEAFGLALAEAGYFSLPVVSHDLPGIAEAVENGRSGVLVPAGDVAALAAAIKRLAGDPNERQSMGTAGKERVLRRFSLQRMVTDFETLYDEMTVPAPHAYTGQRSGLRPYFNCLRAHYGRSLEGSPPPATG